MKTEYLPFTEQIIPEAGKLLADRHARNRKSLPLLPARFEDPQVAAKAVDTLWQKKLKNGYAAFRDGKMIAYLIGETTTLPWGRSGYVYLPGYALAENENPAIMQDLYAMLGDDWVKTGHFNHYLYISVADKNVLDALFDLGFGKERVDALLNLGKAVTPEIKEATGISIRKAGTGDNAHLGSLSDVIFRALAKAPYWHPTVPEEWGELHEGWSELADEKEWTVWLALENEEALGTVGFTAQAEADTDMLASPRTSYLSVAATKPQARGRGISTTLTWHGLEQTRKDGFEICYTNWISPNLLASRFWPRFGFKDVAYRVAKKVSPMIAWAKSE
ncbi:MAG: GNAT family N-acetyltransferase [Anaerolineales bacterium]|nr:GNAT family N-acetyltransferase [Anaerolineales bacterium]